MIQRFHQNDRRSLTFPAVHPCEAVSTETLLNSLVSLSRTICDFHSKFFASQRRNAREAIRQVGVLLIFFEEVLDRGSILSNSSLLCLSELHLTFQKIQFLLEDSFREGSRLWILTKCKFVASQFRILFQAVATVLDVLPLDSIDVGGEVKELVDLVAKQARRARFELAFDDERGVDVVFGIMSQFEKGTEPDLETIKRVLDFLGIRSWSDCNKEIRFLEEELGFEFPDCKERDVAHLSGLVGLMCYSRGVIFEELDHHHHRNASAEEDQLDSRINLDAPTFLNPDDFRCPISLELMTDPVTVSTGQTYDRSSILKWLKAGNLTCPKTGERLKNPELVPNSALKKLIQQFCSENGITLAQLEKKSRDMTGTTVPSSRVAAEAMKFLSKFLVRLLVFGNGRQKIKAAYEIRLLAKSNIYNRSCLIDAGAISPLLNLLSSSTEACPQENAISALLKLSKHSKGRVLIVEYGGLHEILNVLKHGLSSEAKQIAAAIIFYLSSVKDYRKLIGEIPEAIPALVELIKGGTTCGKKNAVVAIFGLIFFPNNQKRVIENGTVPLLIDILTHSDKTDLITDTLAVLSTLADNVEGANSILQASAMPLIKNTLHSTSSRAAKEYCVSTLLSLCNNGGDEVVSVLVKDHSLMELLYSILGDGTPLAGKKARALIRILHKYRETSPVLSSAVPHEQFVRAR
ncbi:U-box domain-containing protein 19-like [Humulus lupulus]|uniref:U-box domain-containing protein 19-like n=1 Tax=Humulus lupulus TaxID=3486 RepID=UPI002B414E99|nr:U-box domain-containing protein 19-like [Humulus lupulus]